MDHNELLAREAIRDLVARYNLYGDTGRLAEMAALFATDGVLEYAEHGDSQRHVGSDGILEFVTNYAARLSSGSDRPSPVFHSVGTHVIDVLDRDHAQGTAYVHMLGAGGLIEWGHYSDKYQRDEDGWRFASRRATTVGRA